MEQNKLNLRNKLKNIYKSLYQLVLQNKENFFGIIFCGLCYLLVIYVKNNDECKKEIKIIDYIEIEKTTCIYTKPLFGISDSLLSILWLPAAIIISIILVKSMRKLKLEKKTHEIFDTTYEVVNDANQKPETYTIEKAIPDTTENKEVYDVFTHNEMYSNAIFHDKYKDMNINLRLVKVNKKRRIDFFIYTTIAIILILSLPLQLYLLIPLTPIIFILIKESIIILKSKSDISKYKKDYTSETKLHPWVIFEIATLLNSYEIISKAWKYKTFKLAIFTLYIIFFVGLGILIYSLNQDLKI